MKIDENSRFMISSLPCGKSDAIDDRLCRGCRDSFPGQGRNRNFKLVHRVIEFGVLPQ